MTAWKSKFMAFFQLRSPRACLTEGGSFSKKTKRNRQWMLKSIKHFGHVYSSFTPSHHGMGRKIWFSGTNFYRGGWPRVDSKGGSISRGRVMSKIEGVKGWAGISCNCEEMLVYTLSRSLSDLCPSLKRILYKRLKTKLGVYVWIEKRKHWLKIRATQCKETPTYWRLHPVKRIFGQRDGDTNIPFGLNYIWEKDITKYETKFTIIADP